MGFLIMNAIIQITVDTPCRQEGAALVVSLLFLLIMTVVGVTALQVASLEERMSGNMRNRNLAFQAAESALRAGELALFELLPPDANTPVASTATFGCTNDPVSPCPLSDTSATSEVWSSANAVTYSGTLVNLAANPQYLIEVLTPSGVTHAGYEPGKALNNDNADCVYRITARGVGGTSTAVVILQSTYKWFYFESAGGGKCHA